MASEWDKRIWQFFVLYKKLCEDLELRSISVDKRGFFIDNLGQKDEQQEYFEKFEPRLLRKRTEE